MMAFCIVENIALSRQLNELLTITYEHLADPNPEPLLFISISLHPSSGFGCHHWRAASTRSAAPPWPVCIPLIRQKCVDNCLLFLVPSYLPLSAETWRVAWLTRMKHRRCSQPTAVTPRVWCSGGTTPNPGFPCDRQFLRSLGKMPGCYLLLPLSFSSLQ